MSYPDDIARSLIELEAHYERFEENTRGGNGYLFFARNRISKQEIAIKFYSGAPGERRHDEPRQLASISSPNVLPILDARMVSDEWGYFITKRCHEGDLDDLILISPSAHRAIDTAISVCRGLSAIHAEGMAHRDLKPGNIVLDNSVPRIADFGSVRALDGDGQVIGTSKHTVLFRPPESFEADEYTKAGDIYQIGLVTYQLLGGLLPYDGEAYLSRCQHAEYSKITDNVEKSLYIDSAIRMRANNGSLADMGALPPWVSRSARRGLRALLNPDPSARIRSVSEAVATISQMRMSTNDWQWKDGVACLFLRGTEYEVRLVDDDIYEAFQKRGSGFRRVPGMKQGRLDKVVACVDK